MDDEYDNRENASTDIDEVSLLEYVENMHATKMAETVRREIEKQENFFMSSLEEATQDLPGLPYDALGFVSPADTGNVSGEFCRHTAERIVESYMKGGDFAVGDRVAPSMACVSTVAGFPKASEAVYVCLHIYDTPQCGDEGVYDCILLVVDNYHFPQRKVADRRMFRKVGHNVIHGDFSK